jgi:hypothetical protein
MINEVKFTKKMAKEVVIDRKEQSETDPYNTDNHCRLLYKCTCGISVCERDNYCLNCGSKLTFVNEPTLDPDIHL